jgi:N-dimethylarginine dimethylaminohydrolase
MDLDSVVLATPDHYRISYAINPLTNKNDTIDLEKAKEQFSKLKARFAANRIPVHLIDTSVADPTGKFPDFVYVSNSALILRGWPTKVAILARYAFPERRGEEQIVGAFLKNKLGYKIITLPEKEGLYFEAQGDCRWSHEGKHLWLPYGAGRTSKSGIEAVKNAIMTEAAAIGWIPPTIHSLSLSNKTTYHLDLCFLPLPNGRLLYHAGSFTAAGRKEIANTFGKSNVIDVPIKYMYVCNSVWLDGKRLLIPRLPDGCRQWMYNATKMHVEETNVDQFHLAGGSVSCMVLPVWKTV